MRFTKIHTIKMLVMNSLCLAAVGTASADVLSLSPMADGFIRSTQSAQACRNISNNTFLIGSTAQPGDTLRGVVAFDLNAPELKDATILNARLVVDIKDRDVSGGGSVSMDRIVELRPLSVSFDEATVDWLSSASGTPWALVGGDFGEPLATVTANPATVAPKQSLTFESDALTQAVQTALGGKISLLLKLATENTQRGIFRFQSGSPRLILEYTPAATSSWYQLAPGQPEAPAPGVSPVPGSLLEPRSQRYAVVAGGHPVEVRANRYDFDVAMFTMTDEPVMVDVMVKDDFSAFTLKPDRHGLAVERLGQTLRFTLDKPARIVLQIPGSTPLALLVTPAETDIPDASAPDVLYFQPGLTNAGTIKPSSGQTVYLAPGALVRGRIEARDVQNVRIMGRGILDVSGHSTQANHKPGILFENSENILVEGIGVRSFNGWWQTLYLNSRDITVAHVNLFGIGVNTDGVDIDAVKNFVVRESFIRAEDDGLGWHSLDAAANGEMITENALAEDLVIWNTTAGNGIRIGASMEGQLWRDITIRRVDILQHAGSGIYSDYSDWAWAENLRFEDMTIEKPSAPIDFYIDRTRYSNASGHLDRRGNIDRLLFEKIVMNGGTIRLGGYDAEHQISTVRFNDCVNAGVPVDTPDKITVNAFVTDVAFNQPLPPEPSTAEGVIDLTACESTSSGAPQYIARAPLSAAGRTRVLAAEGPGASIMHEVTAPQEGAFATALTILATPQGGVAELSLNGTPVASEVDFYAESTTEKTIDIGELAMNTDGPQQLQLTVTGKNPASTGYHIELDSLSLAAK